MSLRPLVSTRMPNIASVLKAEISRVARKEVRGETASLKKAAGIARSDIAALKRWVQDLEQELRRLHRGLPKAEAPATAPAPAPAPDFSKFRFSAKGLASQRKRLALSAEDCGLLVGASGQSIYNWESGDARPRPKHLEAIAGLRKLGKKEASSRLEAMKGASTHRG